VTQPPPLPGYNPYAAPAARVEDFHDDQLVLADRVMRLVAVIVDLAILMGLVAVFAVIAAIMLPVMQKSAQGGDETAMIVFGVIGGGIFLTLLIYNMVLIHRYGQTIGKRIFKIRIVRTDGSPCSLLRYIFARWLPVSLLSGIPFLGYIVQLVDPLMIFRSDQRCLHDLIADTIVVKA
jgi:uncharacterized RDD family membrane protein YckC